MLANYPGPLSKIAFLFFGFAYIGSYYSVERKRNRHAKDGEGIGSQNTNHLQLITALGNEDYTKALATTRETVKGYNTLARI